MFKVAFSLLSNINQSACSTLDRVMNSQSEFTECCISIIGNFQYIIKLIPMLTCPFLETALAIIYKNICIHCNQ